MIKLNPSSAKLSDRWEGNSGMSEAMIIFGHSDTLYHCASELEMKLNNSPILLGTHWKALMDPRTVDRPHFGIK